MVEINIKNVLKLYDENGKETNYWSMLLADIILSEDYELLLAFTTLDNDGNFDDKYYFLYI
jgi:uncharacterized protein YrzB (UPF0473 family)